MSETYQIWLCNKCKKARAWGNGWPENVTLEPLLRCLHCAGNTLHHYGYQSDIRIGAEEVRLAP